MVIAAKRKRSVGGIFTPSNFLSGPVGDQIWKAQTGSLIDVDPSGQWVAWDMMVEPGSGGGIAIKSTSDPASTPPKLLNLGMYPFWIDDRQILCNGMRIIDRSGKEVRSGAAPSNGPLSLRRYYHY